MNRYTTRIFPTGSSLMRRLNWAKPLAARRDINTCMGCWISWLRACAAAKSDECMQSLTALLERDTAFARLAPGVEQMAQLAADVSRLLPDGLAPHIFAGPVREGTLTLFAAHGALAARLRHLEPHLAQNLQRR